MATEYELMMGQLIKFIYFGALYDCPMHVLLNADLNKLKAQVASADGGSAAGLLASSGGEGNEMQLL